MVAYQSCKSSVVWLRLLLSVNSHGGGYLPLLWEYLKSRFKSINPRIQFIKFLKNVIIYVLYMLYIYGSSC